MRMRVHVRMAAIAFPTQSIKKKKRGKKRRGFVNFCESVRVCVCVLRRVFPEYTHIFEKKGLGIRHYTIKR